MRFFITGVAGFIGFHVAKRLLQTGHVVCGYDGITPYYDVRLKKDRLSILNKLDGFEFVHGMLEDAPLVMETCENAKPDVVMHFAAQAGVRYSLENPRSYVESNVKGSFNIIEATNRVRPAHLLMASTSSIYGNNPEVPFSENDKADNPLTIYAATKKSMELMAHSNAHLNAVPTTCFRFFTVYGPWGRPDMALFRFVKNMLEDLPIDVYGHGKMSRDFTYIDDLVEAVIRLVEVIPAPIGQPMPNNVDSLSPVAPFRIVNIGGGAPIDLMDFISTIERKLGVKAKINFTDMQPGDVNTTFASPMLLETLVNYKPESGLNHGVGQFIDWYVDYLTDKSA
ncbi:NAD-dependent epimerase/dehydratase family protein [Rhizobium sp. L43]|uniref:NAD-dependent epimerase/dehydratase family protein n=1 Tax=Rhizobium sp. L43 TaxID=2035452 RepID=UPI000BEA8D94|nr:NAD-dependent epimerase/dehydratase family protein [Rhizobium sp. L43]PDS76403.1 UDP-glucuronate 5-epimerase [Rhizobium sp. L43]